MSTTLQANQTFGAKLLHVLTLGTRDVYKTQNGQLITMKADQGKVEVDDNGEVNIFDAKNVRAKGVNGQEDKFYLHNCTGSNNRGKRLNDAGDIFTQVKDEEATSASAGNDKTNADSDLGNIFNTIINGNEGEVNVENNYYTKGAEKAKEAEKATSGQDANKTDKADKTDKTDKTEKTDKAEEESKTETSANGIFNTTVNGNNGTVNIINNYEPKTEKTEDKKETEKTEDKKETEKATSGQDSNKAEGTDTESMLAQLIEIFKTIINGNNGTVNITNNYNA